MESEAIEDALEFVLIHTEIYIGPAILKAGVLKLEREEPPYTITYQARLGEQKHHLEAASESEAVREGCAWIGEALAERIDNYPGDPFSYPVIEGEPEEDEEED